MPKVLLPCMLRETGMYDPSWILKCILIPLAIILFQNDLFNNNTLSSNEIHFHFPVMFHDKPKRKFSHAFMSTLPSLSTTICICNILYNYP